MAGSDAWKMFLWTFQDVDVFLNMHLGKSSVFILFLTMILDPVLWKCSYGPWDHFRFSAKSVIWLVFYQSDSIFSRKPGFPDYCIFAKFHHAQGGKGFYFFEITMWEKLLFLWHDSTWRRGIQEPPRRHPGGHQGSQGSWGVLDTEIDTPLC